MAYGYATFGHGTPNSIGPRGISPTSSCADHAAPLSPWCSLPHNLEICNLSSLQGSLVFPPFSVAARVVRTLKQVLCKCETRCRWGMSNSAVICANRGGKLPTILISPSSAHGNMGSVLCRMSHKPLETCGGLQASLVNRKPNSNLNNSQQSGFDRRWTVGRSNKVTLVC